MVGVAEVFRQILHKMPGALAGQRFQANFEFENTSA